MSLIDRERIKLQALQKIIGSELKRFADLYDTLLRGESQLTGDICAHLRQGAGKRFRPTLLLLAAKHDGKVPDEAITAAACVELVHTATLLHDDVIDESDVRRGLPTVNSRWGETAALIMGDYLYGMALDTLSRAGLNHAVGYLARSTLLMSQAEMMQLETRYDLGIDEQLYRKIIYYKTASLIESSCAIGAAFHPVMRDHEQTFAEFGRKLGFVFQITDDIFDYLGDQRRIGKPTGHDWAEGRITLPLIAAQAAAAPAERDAFREEFGGIGEDVGARRACWSEVKRFVLDHGGVEIARGAARTFGDEARASLEPLARGAQRELLSVAVEYVIKRLN